MVAEELLLTADDVNLRLPLVRSIVRDIVSLHQDTDERRRRLIEFRGQSSSVRAAEPVYDEEVRQMEKELARDEERLVDLRQELATIGGELTDAETGTVDFRGDLGGDEIWYCWQPGDAEVSYWHAGECGRSDRIAIHPATEASDASGSQPGDPCNL